MLAVYPHRRAIAAGIIIVVVLGGLLAAYLAKELSNPVSPNRKLNISCFAYRDMNENGIYDMADRPYAGLKLEMARPHRSDVSAWSNLAGFTNFKMALDNPKYPVDAPGEYRVQAKPADGWRITSANPAQTLNFHTMEGSPAGLYVRETCEPIGVAPVLTISGVVENDPSNPATAVKSFTARSPAGKSADITLTEDGHYSVEASSGDWILKATTYGGQTVSRVVNVSNAAVIVSTINPGKKARLRRNLVNQRTGFDDLTPSDTLYEIPNGYGGLNWTNWIAVHHKMYKSKGYINATVSSEYVAYNSSGHPASIWSEQPFDFLGGHVAVAWPAAEKDDVIVRAWRGEDLMYEDRFRGSTAGAIYFDADYRDITRLVFSTGRYWQLIIDDIDYGLAR